MPSSHVTGNFQEWTGTTRGNKAWAVVISTGTASLEPKIDFMNFAGVREPIPGDPCNNDGICDPGEDCENCGDCEGKTNGPPSGRFCCGNGVEEPAEDDGRCDGNP